MTSDATRRLAEELDRFEALLAAMSGLRRRDDAARLHELVRMRPELAQRIAAMRDVAANAFSAARDPAVAEEFRSRLSAVQRRVLLHQADWPASSIGARPDDYARAAAAIAEANRAFVIWAREVLSASV